MASLRQQAGRAGRRERESLSLLVGFDGPLDQHFMRHPDNLFGRPVEAVQVRACRCACVRVCMCVYVYVYVCVCEPPLQQPPSVALISAALSVTSYLYWARR